MTGVSMDESASPSEGGNSCVASSRNWTVALSSNEAAAAAAAEVRILECQNVSCPWD